ncbi:hypothetical protein RB2591 [Rhodopirellula baltica SH 1]|uniref:Uncharacterized protein n=1 Tax=Rhodopirellula baltica (strain DSM 10527 / NCIMB 13988 / SH1) TaxID=243090 RepID=Q7UVJ5_RHOBA|nr:hypothetical protein RB2591 [Rhodopirellula baltica SH 1]
MAETCRPARNLATELRNCLVDSSLQRPNPHSAPLSDHRRTSRSIA